MPDASYNQTAFFGGEWSPYAQGRTDDRKYRTSMNVCLNAIPVEEGACPRRPGSAFMATTRSGAQGRVIAFDFSDTTPFTIELTASHLRMFAGRGLVFDTVLTVADISSDNPAVVTLSGSKGWATGDQVMFLFANASSTANAAILRNRVFTLTMIDTTHCHIADPVTGAIVDGSQVNFDPTQINAQIARVLDLSVPYASNELEAVRSVQAAGLGINNENISLLLHKNHQPRALQATENSTAENFSTFAISPQTFLDGPYLDPPVGATLTPTAAATTFNVTIGYNSWSSSTAYVSGAFVSFGGLAYQSQTSGNLNHQPDVSPTYWTAVNNGAAAGPNGFQSGDVGRLIRMLSEPAQWSAGAGYGAGQAVAYNGAYYTAQTANSGAQPDISLNAWLPTTSTAVAAWVWGQITAVLATNSVSVSLLGTPNALIYNAVINTWRLGCYSDAVGWPTCGSYYEGRLWLDTPYPNMFAASVSNDFFNFSPTAADGSIGDGNGITEKLNSKEKNTIYWLEPTSSGLVAGTKKGEFLIRASALQDPITPTSIQAHRVTSVGCYNQVPCHTPLTMVVINRYQRLLYEIFPDLFSGKITAPNLNVYSKHLTKNGVREIAYQSELAPIVWARIGDGTLVGWVYRRESSQATQEPMFVGGHRHALGSGRTVQSIAVNSMPDETSDSLMMTTVDPATGVYHVEQLTVMLDPQDALTSGWFVDDAVTPSGMNATATGVYFYGLWHLNGKTISAVCGGLDLGDYPVSNGQIFVPWQSDSGKFFTLAFLQSLNANTYGSLATSFDSTASTAAGASLTPSVINKINFDQTLVTAPSAVSIKMDFANNNAFIPGTGGIFKVSLTNFNTIAVGTFAQITASGPGYTPDLAWDWTYGVDGYLYFRAVGSNQCPWMKVDPNTWTTVGSFGTSSNFWSGGPTGFGAPDSMCSVFGGANYVVGGNWVSAFSKQIAWMNADTMQFVAGSDFRIESGWGITICPGPQGPLGATVYGISTPETLNFNPAHVTLYQSSIDAASGTTASNSVRQINATDIDATWGGITAVGGFVRDQLDGNLLVYFGGAPSGFLSTDAYIVKMRPGDGSFVWKTKLSSTGAVPNGGMRVSRTAGGVLSWIADQGYLLDTTTGQVNSYSITGISLFGYTVSDDRNGSLYAYVAYGQVPGSPVPGPTSPSSWGGWSSFTLGNVFQGSSTSTVRSTVPAVLGFTYTTRGQIVRPAEQRESGSANGPALGKTRRHHMFSVLLAAAIYGTIKFGTSFSKLTPFKPKSPGGTQYNSKTLFSGVYWDTIEDEYGFDGMLAWEITRPVPGTVTSLAGFLNTQDR